MTQRLGSVEHDSNGEWVVVGVDTHQQVHVAAVMTTLGLLLGSASFPATAAGYRDLITWARSWGGVLRAGVEGTGSYGAGLSRALRAEDIDVLEVNRPDRAMRRRRGKSDPVDAEAAARAVLTGEATATPKSADGPVEAMRVLKLAKDSATKARVQAINQLKAVLVNAEPGLREELEPLNMTRLIARCAGLDAGSHGGLAGAVVHTLRHLAHRVQHLGAEIDDLRQRITATVERAAPRLLQVRGIGPDSAATLLVAAGDNPERLSNEASFAALCGVSPVRASSGKTHRHRLNRGGHRQANAALYRAILTQLRWDERTRNYLQRRISEGLSKREIIRCLKRYLARTIYKIITAPPPSSETTVV